MGEGGVLPERDVILKGKYEFFTGLILGAVNAVPTSERQELPRELRLSAQHIQKRKKKKKTIRKVGEIDHDYGCRAKRYFGNCFGFIIDLLLFLFQLYVLSYPKDEHHPTTTTTTTTMTTTNGCYIVLFMLKLFMLANMNTT